MTRFQIIGIFEGKICTTTEFNGDGYFESGYGYEVCKKFLTIKTEKGYINLVNEINKHFGYKEELIYPNVEAGEFDFRQLFKESKYYEVWFSDYLYIKNFTNEDFKVIDGQGQEIVIHSQGYITLYFGDLCSEEYKGVYSTNNIEVSEETALNNKVKEAIKSCGWNIISNTSIRNSSPAGEDLWIECGSGQTLYDAIIDEYENYDVDEHFEMWYKANRGEPSSPRDLLEDCIAIEEMLYQLSQAVKEVV